MYTGILIKQYLITVSYPGWYDMSYRLLLLLFIVDFIIFKNKNFKPPFFIFNYYIFSLIIFARQMGVVLISTIVLVL